MGEPAVIGRLPVGVEYTHVKQIVLGLPGVLDLPWFTTEENDALRWSRFRGKTFRLIDRVLRQEESRLLATPFERGRNEQVTAMLRHQFIQYFRLALQQWDPNGEKRWLSTSFVATTADLSRRDLVIEVWEPAKGGPRVLDRVIMPPSPPPWGDIRVAYYDPWLAERLSADMCRRHFREVMRRRLGQDWWSKRPSATGWPMLTRYAIPMLYDYLHPFYTVRSYRRDRRDLTPGHYSRQLFRDIRDILQAEAPHLATDLTEAQVQAVVQRYLRNASADRPKGFDMFGIRLDRQTA
ncbi:MAG TPA: hypothetical protein VLA89_05740 [Gemmatimonadales bacterium]|nr:hypothetical protein [Gemmatimonadales bacterium]